MNMQLKEYSDSLIRLKYPVEFEGPESDYLGQYVFLSPGRGGNNKFRTMEIEVNPVPNVAKFYTREISKPTIINTNEMTMSVFRKGVTELQKNAKEAIIISRVNQTEVSWYHWSVVFFFKNYPIYIKIDSEGDFEEDEQMWIEVIQSIEIIGDIPRQNQVNQNQGIISTVYSAIKRIIKGDADSSETEACEECNYVVPETINLIEYGGKVRNFKTNFTIFADHYQFYLWDKEEEPEPPVDYDEDSYQQRLHFAPNVVAVLPVREMDIPVEVNICGTEPKIDLAPFDHVEECSLDLPSGKLQIEECTGGTIGDFMVPSGTYRVRLSMSGLEGVNINDMTGEDSYRIDIWPSAEKDHRYLKKWAGFNS